MRTRLADSRGAGLLLNLMAVAVFAMLGSIVYVTARTGTRGSIYALRQAQALTIAEAGLEDALQELRTNTTWRDGFTDKPFAGGLYTVKLTSETLPVISSTGYSPEMFLLGRAVRTVTARTAWVPGQCPYAIGANRITVMGTIDRYDPEVSLEPSTFTAGADIFSNGNILASGTCPPALVRGDAYAGGSLPSSCYVEGNLYTSTSTLALPTYPCSDCSTVNDNLTGISPLTGYNHASKQLVVDNETVTLQPGRYYFKKLWVKNNGILNVDTSSGTVELWLDGNFVSDTPCQINNLSKRAGRLRFYDLANAGHSVPFVCNTPLHAYIEGVWAQAYVHNEFYGHFCADRVTIEATGKMHYDGGSFASAGWTVGQGGSWSESYARP